MTKAQEKSKTELLRMGCAMWAKERRRAHRAQAAHSSQLIGRRERRKAHGAERMAQEQLIADSSQLIGRREDKSSS
jgi:hypothetical protein